MILFDNRAATVLYKVLNKIKQKKFLLPLNVCPIVPDTFIKANKEFEFIDIELDTLCMDQDMVLQKIKNDDSIDGILFVKTFGIEFDIQPFYKDIKDINPNIFIIDDMCPCIQIFDYDIRSSYANMALFSTGYSKFVDIGYGGYGFLKDKEFHNIFDDKSQELQFLEYKKTIQKKIPLMIRHKQELNMIYKTNIPEKYHLGEKFNNWRFSLLLENKDRIIKKIFEDSSLFASSHYPQVDLIYEKKPMMNTNTNHVHRKIVNLFNDFRFNKEKAYKIVDIINNNLNKG